MEHDGTTILPNTRDGANERVRHTFPKKTARLILDVTSPVDDQVTEDLKLIHHRELNRNRKRKRDRA